MQEFVDKTDIPFISTQVLLCEYNDHLFFDQPEVRFEQQNKEHRFVSNIHFSTILSSFSFFFLLLF
jgi:hypothetical protein